MSAAINPFLDALSASGPAADRADKMALYGWLVGSWDLEVTEFPENGRPFARPGEWHFGWALEGRAFQDVWMVPSRRAGRHEDAAAHSERYGSTLRVYDPSIDAWHIQWTEPVGQVYLRQIGRKEGARIVQTGTSSDGRGMRWSFNDITPDSFVWRSEVSNDRGETWRVNVEFSARRVA